MEVVAICHYDACGDCGDHTSESSPGHHEEETRSMAHSYTDTRITQNNKLCGYRAATARLTPERILAPRVRHFSQN